MIDLFETSRRDACADKPTRRGPRPDALRPPQMPRPDALRHAMRVAVDELPPLAWSRSLDDIEAPL